MITKKVILDVDPGIDDAIALTLALFDPTIEVVAITAVGGNVLPEVATRNVQAIIERLDPPRWPRIGGASLPDDGLPANGAHVNGADGLGNSNFQVSELQHRHPSEKVICDEVRAAPDQVTIIALGPLTNVARAFARDPGIPVLVNSLVIMGGASCVPGNVTPAAEFNIYCDPLAARQVFRTAAKIVGTCIDKFHKVPSHQRKLLSDPRNLPLKTDITVGNAKIQLHVTPVTDLSGKPTGFSLEWSDVTSLRDSVGQLAAINKSQAVIEFQMDGTVMHANENFLKALGYTMDEIRGKHHSLFVSPEVTTTAEYRQFWANLNDGKYDAGEYKRIAKGGREVWIQASYNPIVDGNGKPFKVVKYATDITASKLRNADYEGQLSAIDKAQATIEFDLNGNVLKVNDNFLNAVGYSREEVIGKHHSMFVDSEMVSSSEYRQFWNSLKAGQYQASTFRRIGKAGREVWIQASYNPIYDVNGKLQKIVKYATDITEAKQRQLKLESDIAERHRQDARAAEEMKSKVAQVLDVVNAVADGNFDLTVPDLGDDAVGQVARALDIAVASIRTALLSVQSVSETVASAASQMTSASNEISKGAQHQASSLEETASSLEQITSTVKQNTDNAQQARQLANGSRDVAEKGGAVLTDAIKAMGEINQSSTKIADIITTIDEIAFQTNLLALNAAVEAARAGEQGRGFAVVAAEVRNLSQRSALAAKEIKSLIQDSVRKVENGTALVNQSGKTLEEIVGSVKRVTDIVAEIAAASKEQLTGIEQVNKAVSQMDRVTQNNASQTEEMAGTAESLLGHSSELRELVGKFRLEKQTAGGTTSASRRADGTKPLKARPVETDIEKVTSKLNQMVATNAGYVEF